MYFCGKILESAKSDLSKFLHIFYKFLNLLQFVKLQGLAHRIDFEWRYLTFMTHEHSWEITVRVLVEYRTKYKTQVNFYLHYYD